MQKMTILVVEDDAHLLTGIRDILELEDYSVITSANGRDGLTVLNANPNDPPDAIVSDVMMPHMDGFKFLEEVRKKPNWLHVPFIFLTAKGEKTDRYKGKMLGADQYLTKPFDAEDVLVAVGSAIKRLIQLKELSMNKQDSVSIAVAEYGDHYRLINNRNPPSDINNLLIIEGNENLHHEILNLFEGGNCKVLIVKTVTQALIILKGMETPPDIIVSNLTYDSTNVLSTRNLLSFIEIVRQREKFRNIQYLVVDSSVTKYFSSLFGDKGFLTRKQSRANTYPNIMSISEAQNKQRILVFIDNNYNISGLNQVMKEYFNPEFAFFIRDNNEFRNTIANLNPHCIVFWEDTSLVQKVMHFGLSEDTPLVYISKDSPDIAILEEIYQNGFDELGSTDSLYGAVETAIRQNQTPSLVQVGHEWNIVIASSDLRIRTKIAEYIINNYLAICHELDSESSLLELCNAKEPTLIFLDDTLGKINKVVKTLRENLVETPIIAIVEELKSGLWDQSFKLGIRGYLPLDFSETNLTFIIERLLRWKKINISISELWAEYRVEISELKFQSLIAHLEGFSLLEEINMLYSGLVHDLRNVFYSLEAQVEVIQANEDPKVLSNVQQYIENSRLYLELIANLRVKAVWKPKVFNGTYLVDLITRAKNCVQVRFPKFDCKINHSRDSKVKFIADDFQIVQIFFVLFHFFAENEINPDVNIHLSNLDEITLRIGSTELDHQEIEDFLEIKKIDCNAFVFIKLLHRHNWSYTSLGDGTILLVIPQYDFDNQLRLRAEIAEFANQTELLQQNVFKFPKTTSLTLANVVKETLFDLVTMLSLISRAISVESKNDKELALSARYAQLLARDMLITASNIKLEPVPINLQDIFDVAVDLKRSLLSDCDLHIHIAENTPSILADELGLLQIMINLISNAVEAMHGEGKLHIIAEPYKEDVLIKIGDTGQGIPVDKIGQIFNLSFTTKEGHERGVGLHIVSTIVSNFGGEISVSSEIGEGTTFQIILPAHVN